MRFIRLFLFHVKDYLSDQYFVWLTITSTTSIFLMQYIMAYATHNLNNTQIWLQSGIFGMWTSCTTVAGCISFERYKGTLPYLLNSQYDERASLSSYWYSFSLHYFINFANVGRLCSNGHFNFFFSYSFTKCNGL